MLGQRLAPEPPEDLPPVNKFEKVKQEKDGFDVYDSLMRASKEGWEVLDEDDVARLKWYGLYPHNAKDGHFMLRTKWCREC